MMLWFTGEINMNFVVEKTDKYYDTILDIYQQVLENDEKNIHLLIYIKQGETNLSLLQDFIDLVVELQKEFGFNLTTDIKTDIDEIKNNIA